MHIKRILSIVLILFAVGSVAYMFVNEANREDAEAPVRENRPDYITVEDVEPEVIAYFFYGDKDCTTCDTLETYAYEALVDAYRPELESGTLAWRALNMDAPANAHFIEEFGLYAKTLVLVEMKDGERGRHENLGRIWELVSDKDAFFEFVQSKTQEFLERAA